MVDVVVAADRLEESATFESILADWTPGDARNLLSELGKRGWESVEPNSYCSVAIVHRAVRKNATTLDIVASNLMGPFVSVTRYVS